MGMHNKGTYTRVLTYAYTHIDIRVYAKYERIIRVCVVRIYLSCIVPSFFDMAGPCNNIFALLPCKPEKRESNRAALLYQRDWQKENEEIVLTRIGLTNLPLATKGPTYIHTYIHKLYLSSDFSVAYIASISDPNLLIKSYNIII